MMNIFGCQKVALKKEMLSDKDNIPKQDLSEIISWTNFPLVLWFSWTRTQLKAPSVTKCD